MYRSLRIVLATAAAAAIAVLGSASAASAHVTVSPSDATQGGEARIAFRVPDESDSASTTKLDVYLPTDQPVASVLVMPVPGWTSTVTKTTLRTPITTDDGDQVTEAVSQITWTATAPDTAIKPGQFQEFPVSVGPLPKAASMTFKALQTYSDGSLVRWIDQTTPGQAEPDHPAPVLTLASGTGGSTMAGGASAAPAAATKSTSGIPNKAALTVSIIGAVLGVTGLILGARAFSRSRPTA